MLVEHESVLLILNAGLKNLDITDGVMGDMTSERVLAFGRIEDGEENSDLKLFKNCIFLKMILLYKYRISKLLNNK